MHAVVAEVFPCQSVQDILLSVPLVSKVLHGVYMTCNGRTVHPDQTVKTAGLRKDTTLVIHGR